MVVLFIEFFFPWSVETICFSLLHWELFRPGRNRHCDNAAMMLLIIRVAPILKIFVKPLKAYVPIEGSGFCSWQRHELTGSCCCLWWSSSSRFPVGFPESLVGFVEGSERCRLRKVLILVGIWIQSTWIHRLKQSSPCPEGKEERLCIDAQRRFQTATTIDFCTALADLFIGNLRAILIIQPFFFKLILNHSDSWSAVDGNIHSFGTLKSCTNSSFSFSLVFNEHTHRAEIGTNFCTPPVIELSNTALLLFAIRNASKYLGIMCGCKESNKIFDWLSPRVRVCATYINNFSKHCAVFSKCSYISFKAVFKAFKVISVRVFLVLHDKLIYWSDILIHWSDILVFPCAFLKT